MSSRELLVILAHLHPDSAFKKAVGPDGWSENQRVAAATANTLMRLLHTTHVSGGGEPYEIWPFMSPAEQAEQAMEAAELDDARDDLFAHAYGQAN